MSVSYRYLIVGAGTAGHFAAEEIRRHDEQGTIAIVGDEPHRPYHRPPLSKGVLTGKVNPLATYLRKDNFYEDNRIDVFTGVLAVGLDPGAKKVTLSDGRMLGYEKLLLATGGKARDLAIPGDDLPGVHTLRTLDDATAILEAGRSAKHALIIGAGFISAEVATSLWSMGVRCSIIMRGDYLLQRVLPRELSQRLHEEAKEFGVELISGDAPIGFEAEEGRLARAITRQGRAIDCDLAVAGIGLDLNVGFATAAGVALAGDGGILTDGFMRTSIPDIWAAGDIASYDDRSFARRLRIERTESAKGQGLVAGADMAGVEVDPYCKIPLYTFHIFDLSIKVFGVFETGDLLRIGSLDERSCAYYAFRDGVLEGYLGYNRPYAETKMVKQQIQDRAGKDEIISSLREFENAPIATVNG